MCTYLSSGRFVPNTSATYCILTLRNGEGDWMLIRSSYEPILCGPVLFRHLFCLVLLLLPVHHECDCRDSRSPAGTERTSVTTLSPVPRQVRHHFIHPSQQYMFLSCCSSPFHAFNTPIPTVHVSLMLFESFHAFNTCCINYRCLSVVSVPVLKDSWKKTSQ